MSRQSGITARLLLTHPPMSMRPIPGRLALLWCLLGALAASTGATPHAQEPMAGRRVNVPYLPPGSEFQPAIFWFGKVEGVTNYADVRMYHNDTILKVVLHIPDRELWYNPSATQSQTQLVTSDAVSVLLDVSGATGGAPGTSSYWFIKQFSSARGTYRGDGTGWASTTLPFTATDGWRGSGPNNPAWDLGWSVSFDIPYASLGLAGRPAPGTVWSFGVALHDRDDQAATPIPDQVWPETLDRQRPATWGQLHFGRPSYTPSTTVATGTTVVRQGLSGAIVPDAAVGGHSTCGGSMNAWTQWGNANYAGYPQLNIQNQWDIADFMCFSKYYVTFPLASLPAGKSIVSAAVTLNMFGNAGYTPTDAQPSAINVLTVRENWDERTITWNNAPYAAENIGVTEVQPVSTAPPDPYTWDVSAAVAAAYREGMPLRLVFYSTDGDYHSGKYFYTSDSTDWGGNVRPSLDVRWGEGVGNLPSAPTGLRITIRPPGP
jgi:hypothetical protein